MKAWTSALAIACVGLGVTALSVHAQPPRPGGPGAAGGDTFEFKVCNRSKITLHVAMLYKDGNGWRTVGWINYKPNDCAPVRGRFPRNDFYWYAEDGPGNVTYGGKDAFGCVHPSDGFNRVVSGDYQCGPGEKVVGFTKIDDASVQNGVTLTD